MMSGLKVLLILTILKTVTGQMNRCCLSKDPEYGGIKANCSHAGISGIPKHPNDSITTLDLSFNRIEILYDNDFLNLTELRFLDISFNPTYKVERFAFKGLSSLLILEFNGHQLDYTESSVPVDILSPLRSLTKFSWRSDISRFPYRQFVFPNRVVQPLTKLTHLNIDTSAETVFGTEFSNLTSLQELYIGEYMKQGYAFECGLSFMTKDRFEVFSALPIRLLDLTNCSFVDFHVDFLRPFEHLLILRMNNISLHGKNDFVHLVKVFHVFEYRNMTEISLRKVWTYLPHIGFNRPLNVTSLSKICLEHLDLSQNLINVVNFDVLFTRPLPPFIRCIKRLNLANNRITGTIKIASLPFVMSSSKNLEELDLSNQLIFSYNKYLVRAQHPAYHHRQILVHFTIFLNPNLKYVNIAGLPHEIGELKMDIYFVFAKSLRYFNVSYCGLFNIKGKIYGLENLEVLDLSGNVLSILNETLFDESPKLKSLHLSSTLLDYVYLSKKGKRLFQPLRFLEVLDLSRNDLISLPYDLFASMATLKVINLAHNKLLTIPNLSPLVQLNAVYFNHNAVKIVSQDNRVMLESSALSNPNLRVYMEKNVFTCTCEALPFLLWLGETNVQLDKNTNYSCIESTGAITNTHNIYYKWNGFRRRCASSIVLNIAEGLFGFFITLLVTAYAFVKNRMKLKLLLWRMIGRNIYPKNRDEFKYDAFIIYTNSTASWACNQLRLPLEECRGIKLNLPDRDHIPGGSRADDLLDAMRDSWKIVLILTQEFLRGDLAYFTMCNCVSSVTLTTPQRLIVVIDNRLDVPANLEFLLDAVNEDNILHVDFLEPLSEEFWKHLADLITSKPNVN